MGSPSSRVWIQRGPQIQSFSLAHEKTNNNVLYVLVISRSSQNFWKLKSNMRFCFFPLHCDWARKLAQFSQSIRYRTETKRHLVTCVLPRFKKIACFYFMCSLAPLEIFLAVEVTLVFLLDKKRLSLLVRSILLQESLYNSTPEHHGQIRHGKHVVTSLWRGQKHAPQVILELYRHVTNVRQ